MLLYDFFNSNVLNADYSSIGTGVADASGNLDIFLPLPVTTRTAGNVKVDGKIVVDFRGASASQTLTNPTVTSLNVSASGRMFRVPLNTAVSAGTTALVYARESGRILIDANL